MCPLRVHCFSWLYMHYTLNQQRVTEDNIPKCLNCDKATVVIIEREHYFSWLHIYYVLTLFLWDLSTPCVVDHLWVLLLRSFLSLLSIGLLKSSISICTSCILAHELPQNHSADNRKGTWWLIAFLIPCFKR